MLCGGSLVIIMGIKIMDVATKMIVPREMDDREKIEGKKEATKSRITQNMIGNFARDHRLPRMMSHTIQLSNSRQMCIPEEGSCSCPQVKMKMMIACP